MSSFLPDNFGSDEKILSSDQSLTDGDKALMKRVFGKPQLIPSAFWSYAVDYLAVNFPNIPISQISGFAQFTAQIATTIATAENTASSTYTDLATVGPTLSALPDGKYLLLYAAQMRTNSSSEDQQFYSPKINSTEALDADAAVSVPNASLVTGGVFVGFAVKTLSNTGNNTVTMRYRAKGGISNTASNRGLVALRYANP